MRETTLLAIVAAAALLGMGLGYVLMPKKPAPMTKVALPAVSDVPAAKLAKVTRDAAKTTPDAEQPDPASTPEAIHAWRRQDKDALKQRIALLSNADVEQLCFTLQLIPRDEVFDKINVKGRLNRHIDNMRMDAEFGDIDTAFRDLRRDR